MDTSMQARNTVLLANLCALLLSGCSSNCTNISNRILVTEWTGSLPNRVVLYRYKKDSDFSVLLQKSERNLYASKSQGNNESLPVLSIDVNDYKALPIDYDYKLVLDENEYRISEIGPGRPGSGCRIPEGKANHCDLAFDSALDFRASCRVPVTGSDR